MSRTRRAPSPRSPSRKPTARPTASSSESGSSTTLSSSLPTASARPPPPPPPPPPRNADSVLRRNRKCLCFLFLRGSLRALSGAARPRQAASRLGRRVLRPAHVTPLALKFYGTAQRADSAAA
eukprot:Amastigsp_a509870_397.p1 type:complete len:123 gc:universal Amastigsp_a509870_397:187-555(+)